MNNTSVKSNVVLRGTDSMSLADMVRDCLVQCDWESWLSRGAKVVIKPNLCTAVADKVLACNTDVRVTRALCEALLTRTNRIVIGESGHLRQNPWQAFAASGYVEMAKELGIKLVNFSEEPTKLVKCDPIGELALPRQLLEADAYINVPVLKTHALTYFTGALKNQWGCVPDCRDRLRYHRSIHTLLSSIQRALHPNMILMDGIVAMEGRGPVAGNPRQLNVVLASRDAVAIDATAMRLVGLNPEKSRHVVIAAGKNIGNFERANIQVDGDWDRHTTQFVPPPRDVANTAMFYVSQYQWFVKHILANDKIYFPIRDVVVAMRKFGVTSK
jgi:uncharacterized protein (DUF362 family)